MRSIHATMIGVLLLLCGIFCLFSPVESSSVIPYLIGIALVATGIGKIFRWADEKRYFGQSRWNLAGAIISLLFGVLIIMSPALQLSMGASMIVLIGCWITMMGILRIVHAFKLRKIDAAYVDGWPWDGRRADWINDVVLREYTSLLRTDGMVLVKKKKLSFSLSLEYSRGRFFILM